MVCYFTFLCSVFCDIDHSMKLYPLFIFKCKFHEIPLSGYLVMAPDGRRDSRQTDGHGQNYNPPPSAGDNKY